MKNVSEVSSEKLRSLVSCIGRLSEDVEMLHEQIPPSAKPVSSELMNDLTNSFDADSRDLRARLEDMKVKFEQVVGQVIDVDGTKESLLAVQLRFAEVLERYQNS